MKKPVKSSATSLSDRQGKALGQLMMGYRASKAIMLACELEIFVRLEQGPYTSGGLAKILKVSERHLEILLNALCSLELLKKRGNLYFITPFACDWLHPSGQHSLANNYRYQEFLSNSYAGLLGTIKRGKPARGLENLLAGSPNFVSHYMAGMEEITQRPARELARLLPLEQTQHMLDLGGGHGLYSAACLEKSVSLHATILDLPETLAYTEMAIQNKPWKKRISLMPGNYKSSPYGFEHWDMILMSHITHDEAPSTNKVMIAKAYQALTEGGCLVMHDFINDPTGTKPLFNTLFSLHLSSYTDKGQVYTIEDYLTWMKAAGFGKVKRIEVPWSLHGGTTLLIAEKKGKGSL